MKLLFIATGFIALLALSVSNAWACRCAGTRAPCQEYGEASAVFVGTVIDSRIITVKEGDYERQMRAVRLSSDSPFRGVEGSEVEVLTGLGGGDCGFRFVQTQQYLVYAYEQGGKLSTGICTRTRSISKAEEDLVYIRGLAGGRAGATINGEVVRYRRGKKGNLENQPLGGIIITIEGQTKRETKTDAKGLYRVEDLSAGDYVVKVSLPEGLATRGVPEQKVKLPGSGCSVVSFWLESDGQLSGRVLNPRGLPVNKAEIFILESDKERYQGYWNAAYADEYGNYSFKRIPPGRYVLSIRFDGMTSQQRPFPATFYPGVGEKSQAAVISIKEGQRVESYNLVVPPLPWEYDVEGIVLWANGKPALNARVEYGVGGILYGVKVNEQGRFCFKAYAGLKLGVSAMIEAEKGKYVRSNGVEVLVAAGLQPIRLILPI